ncbi:MAG: FMN-binding protein [Acholeplasmataceae bacterium]|nr:FMN-binding protein [Acholeplasmataceae bacterium]
MNQNIRMIFFVIVLGTITSILLIGMDILTKDRIIANEEALLKSAVLSANQVSYSFTNIHDVFAEEIEVITSEGLTLYYHKDSGNISYVFEGGGVWGPIIGMITLQSDFETIVAISILQQEETPGLGGIVADPLYLAKFVGIKMVPTIEIRKDPAPNKENEVDAITGATRTSSSFERILNDNYVLHLDAWNSHNE